MLATGRLDREEVREEYRRKVHERLTDAKVRCADEPSVACVYGVFKDVVLAVASEVLGYRAQGEGGRKIHGGQMKSRRQWRVRRKHIRGHHKVMCQVRS